MTTTTPALVLRGAKQPFETGTVERRDLRPDDVLIDIAYAGICHSDLHQGAEDWGTAIFPMVPGHEIVGHVAAVGPDVTRVKVGDTVGVGCMVDSCGECEFCKDGEEQFCTKGFVGTYNARGYDGEVTYGGYSKQVVVTERFVVHVPNGLDLATAAPLLCAGITLWTPLQVWKAGPGTRVAVVGLGGLGHMGVQLAHALGCHVTVLSQSLSKEADGRRLGADDYRATSDPQTFKDLRNSFDLVLNTVSASLPFDRYLSLLRVDGTMVNLGVSGEKESFRMFSLIGARRRLAGSNIGGIQGTQDVLDFCAEHGIAAEVEVVPASQVDEAWERVVRSDVKFRFVIDVATIGA